MQQRAIADDFFTQSDWSFCLDIMADRSPAALLSHLGRHPDADEIKTLLYVACGETAGA